MGKLIIHCDGGFSNRLLGLIGGIYFANLLETEFIVSWSSNSWCGCDFDNIFEFSNEVIKKDINVLFEENKDNFFVIHDNQTSTVIRNMISLEDLKNLKKEIFQNKNIIYYQNSIPNSIPEDEVIKILRKLKFKKEILDTVESFIKKFRFEDNVEGYHFRKTDYAVFQQYDENLFHNIFKTNGERKFFVCSDDEETEKRFSIYDNVIFREKKYFVQKLDESKGWNDEIIDTEGRKFNFNVKRSCESVIEGIIDLLILSKTRIMSEGYSSFLKLSKLINKI